MLRPWRGNQRAQRDLAHEQQNDIRLERQRNVYGWGPGSVVSVFGVALVADEAELDHAKREVLSGEPTKYVILRINEGGGPGEVNRAHDLMQLIETQGNLARPPTRGEYEALEEGNKLIQSRGER